LRRLSSKNLQSLNDLRNSIHDLFNKYVHASAHQKLTALKIKCKKYEVLFAEKHTNKRL